MSLYEAVGMLVFGFLVGRHWIPKPRPQEIMLTVMNQHGHAVVRAPLNLEPSRN